MKLNGCLKFDSKLEARLSEPFFAGTTAHECIDQPGFASAAKLWENDPNKYSAVARDLFDLWPPDKVAKNHKLSVTLVRSVRGLYPELVHAGKLRLMANLEEACLLLSTRLIDEANELDISKVPAALASVVEKLSLLSGGATIRTEHVETRAKVVTSEELRSMFERLPSAKSEDHL